MQQVPQAQQVPQVQQVQQVPQAQQVRKMREGSRLVVSRDGLRWWPAVLGRRASVTPRRCEWHEAVPMSCAPTPSARYRRGGGPAATTRASSPQRYCNRSSTRSSTPPPRAAPAGGSWQRGLDVNLPAPLVLASAAARQMIAQGSGGAIAILSSYSAVVPPV